MSGTPLVRSALSNAVLCVVAMLSLVLLLGGCAKNRVDGGADLSLFGGAPAEPVRTVEINSSPKPDDVVAKSALEVSTKPATQVAVAEPIPAAINLAVARVQSPHYDTASAHGIGCGKYSLVVDRDVENYEDLQRLAKLPHVQKSFALTDQGLPAKLDSDAELRKAALAQGADMLMIYTFDSRYSIGNYYQTPGLLLLDVQPDRPVKLHTVATALIMDARTGQILGRVTNSNEKTELAATWSSDENAQQIRRMTEKKAFTDLVGQVENLWKTSVAK